VDKLVQLAERYCVVAQTLQASPGLKVSTVVEAGPVGAGR